MFVNPLFDALDIIFKVKPGVLLRFIYGYLGCWEIRIRKGTNRDHDGIRGVFKPEENRGSTLRTKEGIHPIAIVAYARVRFMISTDVCIALMETGLNTKGTAGTALTGITVTY